MAPGTVVLVDGAARATVRTVDLDGVLVRIHEDNTSHRVSRSRLTVVPTPAEESAR